jgi:hypothetical protein
LIHADPLLSSSQAALVKLVESLPTEAGMTTNTQRMIATLPVSSVRESLVEALQAAEPQVEPDGEPAPVADARIPEIEDD